MKRLQQVAADLTRGDRGRSRWVCIVWPLKLLWDFTFCICIAICITIIIIVLSDLQIVRRYISTGNPPSQKAFTSHCLTTTFFKGMLFLQFLKVDHLSGWIEAGTRCYPLSESATLCVLLRASQKTLHMSVILAFIELLFLSKEIIYPFYYSHKYLIKWWLSEPAPK